MRRVMQEKQAIMSFASYWRQMQQAPVSGYAFMLGQTKLKDQYFMGRPEAQLVLIALTEFASRG